MYKVVITDHGFDNVDSERAVIEAAGGRLVVERCKTEDDVVAAVRDADAVIAQWAPVGSRAIESMTRCRIIVRYGIGVDNVDIDAADHGAIPVCNVPDYCIDEVADHTMALALALTRQLQQLDARVRSGVWRIVPDAPMPSSQSMKFGTVGFGRVARAVHARAAGFGFSRVAVDPVTSAQQADSDGVTLVDFETLLAEADVISLHAPLTPETSRLFNGRNLERMRRGSILINTSRGGLVDAKALAEHLVSGHIGGAGLDVFEDEPLGHGHPIRRAPNAILTSHVAWFSNESVPRLQVLAAEEAVRGLRGEELANPVGRTKAAKSF